MPRTLIFAGYGTMNLAVSSRMLKKRPQRIDRDRVLSLLTPGEAGTLKPSAEAGKGAAGSGSAELRTLCHQAPPYLGKRGQRRDLARRETNPVGVLNGDEQPDVIEAIPTRQR